MSRLSDTSPEAQRVLNEAYRAMPAWRKWELLDELYRFGRSLHAAGLADRRPGVTPAEIRDDWATTHLGGCCVGLPIARGECRGPADRVPPGDRARRRDPRRAGDRLRPERIARQFDSRDQPQYDRRRHDGRAVPRPGVGLRRLVRTGVLRQPRSGPSGGERGVELQRYPHDDRGQGRPLRPQEPTVRPVVHDAAADVPAKGGRGSTDPGRDLPRTSSCSSWSGIASATRSPTASGPTCWACSACSPAASTGRTSTRGPASSGLPTCSSRPGTRPRRETSQDPTADTTPPPGNQPGAHPRAVPPPPAPGVPLADRACCSHSSWGAACSSTGSTTTRR